MNPIVFAALAIALGPKPLKAPEPKVTYLDLQPLANQKLKEGLGNQGNNLAALPEGEKAYGGVKFKIGEGLIQLGSPRLPDRPEKVEGIKVGQALSKLHVLHACHHTAEEGAIIGYLTVTYEDGSDQTVPIVYGKDVLDWWYYGDAKGPTRGKVAWEGSNDDVKAGGGGIRLYLLTWKNPEPTKKVASIDFGSTGSTGAAPFCVAMSAEE